MIEDVKDLLGGTMTVGKRLAIGVLGFVVLVIGIIMIPYPGPGWLVVFTGLAILAREFAWARHLLHTAKGKYDQWLVWLKAQNLLIRIVVVFFTTIVVLFTLWMLNTYGILAEWYGLDWRWTYAPWYQPGI